MTEPDGSLLSSISQNSPELQARLLHLSDREAGGLIYIEQLDAGSGCPAPNRPLLKGVNSAQKRALLFHPSCKSWACPVCGPVNKARWIARTLHGVQTLIQQQITINFLTLSSHEKLRGRASYAVWPSAWAALRHRYYRIVPPDQRFYIAVPERHRDGTKHTHSIITGDLSERWWKDNARECGLGYMADLQEVVTLGVGGYMGKYLGKTLDEAWPKNTRRINTSRSWPKLPELPTPDGWIFLKLPSNRSIQAESRDLTRSGYEVTVCGSNSAWTLIDRFSME